MKFKSTILAIVFLLLFLAQTCQENHFISPPSSLTSVLHQDKIYTIYTSEEGAAPF